MTAAVTGRGTRPLGASVVAIAFGGLIGWSAFLLFSVEPLVGRIVLPVFGGTPAVWATTLFFFQAVLLLGYLYGHVSVTRLGLRRGATLHVGLIVAAGIAIIAAPARAADLRDPALPEVINLIGMLGFTVGLPAFVLTTTTPLVSVWYAASRSAADGDDAYWLYALSNAGSLLALLAYPFVIEPRLGLAAQRGAWAAGFAAFGIAVAAGAIWSIRRGALAGQVTGLDPGPPADAGLDTDRVDPLGDGDRHGDGADRAARTAPVTWQRRLTWLLLAAVPSGLLNAVTTFIATDLVSAPLLWLLPLSIYLVTFIVAFSDRGRRIVPAAILLSPAAITLMWVPYGSAGGWPILALVAVLYGGLGVVAVALHGRLALDRPSPAHLTQFYLVIATGGALASAFVALLAPAVFPDVWEFPILLVLALAALAIGAEPTARVAAPPRRRAIDLSPFLRNAGSRLGPYLVVAVMLQVLLVRDASLGAEASARWLLVGGLVLLVGARPAFLAVSTGLVLVLAVFVLQPAAVFRARSFFGVTAVLRPAGASVTTLTNGTTVHGIQSTDPARAAIPEAYYSVAGPFGDAFRVVAADGRAHDVAAVGLGAGAVATYLRPGWSMTFFEIDPLVADVASDPRFFTYLSGAAVRPRIVLGDARLSLRDVPDGSFDAVIVDAFSSDAIPTHLLTSEAMAEYLRVTQPGGLVLVHVSNRYYDLAPAVAAAAAANGRPALQRIHVPSSVDARDGATITDAVIVTTSDGAIATLESAGWTPLDAAAPPMTDDFMDVLRFLRPLW